MKVAVICDPLLDRDGPGDFLYRGFKQICEAEHFNTGFETEGFDHYFYVDDGPSRYSEPKFHPATYIAIDLVIPHVYYVQSPEEYIVRMKNFDHNYVFATDTLKYCKKNGINAKMMGFAADPQFHYPKKVDVKLDWTAIWTNYDSRVTAVTMAYERFPDGWCVWRGTGVSWPHDDDLARGVSLGKCSLNIYRANMVNMRVFEIMAIGTVLLTQRHKDLKRFGFKEGRHYLGFDEFDEMLDKIQWVKDNQVEANKIAKRARRFVLNKHTYRHRAMQLISDVCMI